VLFSATIPAHIDRMARAHLSDPVRISIRRDTSAGAAAPLVRQTAYVVTRAHKPAALGRVLDLESPTAALVFCRTREEVDSLTETLNGRGYRAEALHGGLSQEQRDRVMGRLRAQTADLLVATDVAARGLDVDHLSHVVNYNVPSAPEAYVHRVGRVGRAGREGVAITLAEPRERRMLATIERTTGQRIALAQLPSVADLRAKRLERTRAALRAALLDSDGEAYRGVVESLAEEFDLMSVALAAVGLAHEASGAEVDEEEIPDAPPPSAGPPRDARTSRGAAASGRRTGVAPGRTKIFVGSGKVSGLRPQDLVGAIAGESSLSGRDVGAIEIFDRFSLVEVPDGAVDEVVQALRGTLVKGRKVTVRRER
jgi:ATP-dependent RNA helicase DeaD